jgi:hypothetical protein
LGAVKRFPLNPRSKDEIKDPHEEIEAVRHRIPPSEHKATYNATMHKPIFWTCPVTGKIKKYIVVNRILI